jgi:hypothetical protein
MRRNTSSVHHSSSSLLRLVGCLGLVGSMYSSKGGLLRLAARLWRLARGCRPLRTAFQLSAVGPPRA